MEKKKILTKKLNKRNLKVNITLTEKKFGQKKIDKIILAEKKVTKKIDEKQNFDEKNNFDEKKI